MPALPDVPNVVRVDLKGTLSEDTDVVNRLFFRYSGSPPSTAAVQAMADALATGYVAHMESLFFGDMVNESITVTDLSSSTGAVGFNASARGGTDPGIAINAGAAVLISNRVARRSRGGHGRTYWAGPAAAHLQDPQTWTSSYQTAFHAGNEAWFATAEGVTFDGMSVITQCVVSYYHGFTNFTGPTGRSRPRSTVRPTPLVDDVLARTVNSHVASQRRRNLVT